MYFSEAILKKKNTIKYDTFWYTIGTISNSATSVLLMLFVTRILGVYEAGIFSISYSIAQLMLTVGWFSTRSFQVSDINEEFKFNDYLSFKIILSIISIIGGIIYSLILGNDGYELLVTILCCFLNLGDIFADLCSARLQQLDKLFIAGISYFLRAVGYIFVFFVTLVISKSLAISILLAFLYSIFELFIFDRSIIKNLNCGLDIGTYFNFRNILRLLFACFPLFISSFITNFIVNIPKNSIEIAFTQDVQAYYNIILMPSYLVNMFNMFIFVPLFTKIARTWNVGNFSKFFKLLFSLILLLLLISSVVLIGCFILGIPFLELLYAVDLGEYKNAFMILICAGCLTGLNSILSYVFTVIRKQKIVLLAYIFGLIIAQVSINPLIKNIGLLGASIDYLLGISTIALFMTLSLFIVLRKKKYKLEVGK